MAVIGRDRILQRAKALRTFDVEVPHLDGETVRFREITGADFQALKVELAKVEDGDEGLESIALLLSKTMVDEAGKLAFPSEKGVGDLLTLPAALLLFLGQKAGELIGLTPEAVAGEVKN